MQLMWNNQYNHVYRIVEKEEREKEEKKREKTIPIALKPWTK